jgi:hypothetical protein
MFYIEPSTKSSEIIELYCDYKLEMLCNVSGVNNSASQSKATEGCTNASASGFPRAWFISIYGLTLDELEMDSDIND